MTGGVVWLVAAGVTGGGLNAIVGGGSFITLPALVAAGLPSVAANASSAAALYPGGAASAFVYRHGTASVCGVSLRPLAVASIAGGAIGALLLLSTPLTVFDRILPWLLLMATLALAFGPRLVGAPTLRLRGRAAVVLVQFLLGVYAGYFGGAVGLLMIAGWRIFGEDDLKALHRPRTLFVTAANTAGIALLIAAGVIRWRAAIPVAAGALVGGSLGALAGRRLPASAVRAATLVVTIAITAAFFVRAYR